MGGAKMAARIKAPGGRLFGRYGPQYKDGGGGSGGPRALILVVERKESGQNFPRFYLNKNVIIMGFFHRAESELATIFGKNNDINFQASIVGVCRRLRVGFSPQRRIALTAQSRN